MKKVANLLMLLAALALLLPGKMIAADDPWAAARFIKSREKPVATDFTTLDINGETVRLKEFRGKVVMLFFWASW